MAATKMKMPMLLYLTSVTVFVITTLWTSSCHGFLLDDTTSSDTVDIAVTPTTIIPGVTTQLLVNCTLPRSTLLVFDASLRVQSIAISYRSDNKSSYTPLVTKQGSASPQRARSPNHPYIGQADGKIDHRSTSYLSASWFGPSGQASGMYRCSVKGRDGEGNAVEWDSQVFTVSSVKLNEKAGMTLVMNPPVIHRNPLTPQVALVCSLHNGVRLQVMPTIDDIVIYYRHSQDWKFFAHQSSSETAPTLFYQTYDFKSTVVGSVTSTSLSYVEVDMQLINAYFDHLDFMCKASGQNAKGEHVVLNSPVVQMRPSAQRRKLVI